MADKITTAVSTENPIILCCVVGGVVCVGNILPHLNFMLQVDYIHATRYGGETSGSTIQWCAYPRIDLANRTIVVIDDILDGGITLQEVVNYCNSQQASKVITAVLADKQRPREEGGLAKADIVGTTLPDRFVFGAGMDYKGYFRNLNGIFAAIE